MEKFLTGSGIGIMYTNGIMYTTLDIQYQGVGLIFGPKATATPNRRCRQDGQVSHDERPSDPEVQSRHLSLFTSPSSRMVWDIGGLAAEAETFDWRTVRELKLR